MPSIGFTRQSSVYQTLFCSEWCLGGNLSFFSLLILEVGNILWLVSLHSKAKDVITLSESYSESHSSVFHIKAALGFSWPVG